MKLNWPIRQDKVNKCLFGRPAAHEILAKRILSRRISFRSSDTAKREAITGSFRVKERIFTKRTGPKRWSQEGDHLTRGELERPKFENNF